MNLGKVEIWETSLDRIVTLREAQRASCALTHATPFSSLDRRVFGTPVPVGDWHAETIEYVGLLKSVLTARKRYVVLELGAGWGPRVVIFSWRGDRHPPDWSSPNHRVRW